MTRYGTLPAGNGVGRQAKRRSALGVGATTLVTIVTVLLLVTLSVLSLVSARSNLELSQMVVEQAKSYYDADREATVWYANLDTFVGTLNGEESAFAEQLREAGYEIQEADNTELRVIKSFTVHDTQTLMVSVQINGDKTTTIRQWQT